jgi:hypothetical protein
MVGILSNRRGSRGVLADIQPMLDDIPVVASVRSCPAGAISIV